MLLQLLLPLLPFLLKFYYPCKHYRFHYRHNYHYHYEHLPIRPSVRPSTHHSIHHKFLFLTTTDKLSTPVSQDWAVISIGMVRNLWFIQTTAGAATTSTTTTTTSTTTSATTTTTTTTTDIHQSTNPSIHPSTELEKLNISRFVGEFAREYDSVVRNQCRPSS